MQVLRPNGAIAGASRNGRLLLVPAVLAALAILIHIGVAFWAHSEFTQPEGIVATQVLSFAQDAKLYYDLKQYPYTVCAYMPIFYGLVAGLSKVGLPVLLAGRVVSLIALASILVLIWKILFLYSRDRACATTGLVLAGLTQLLLGWGIVGQVDMLAIAFSLAAFHQYSRYRVNGAPSLDWAAALALAGLLTKQTVIAAPATIFLLLLLDRPRRALRFAAVVAGLGGAIVLSLDAMLQGTFLANTVFANLNPFAFYKLQVHLEYLAVALAPLLAVVLIGAPKALRMPARAAYLYLCLALAVLLLTAAKVGSDSNYQIELAILLVICTCLALHALDFFSLYRAGSQSWVTLLVLPLAIFAVQNLRVITSSLALRIGHEKLFRAQLRELEPFLQGAGRMLSTDSNALVAAKRRFEVEPLIYRLLVEAGRVDGRQVLADIDRASFQTVLLYENLADKPDPDPEFPRLPNAQMAAIRKNYHLVKHLPGPYLSGLYIYQPTSERSQ